MVELRGIIQYYDDGQKHVKLVIRREHSDIYETHELGLDISVNKGRILAELARLETAGPVRLIWPHHIKAEDMEGVKENDKDIKVG